MSHCIIYRHSREVNHERDRLSRSDLLVGVIKLGSILLSPQLAPDHQLAFLDIQAWKLTLSFAWRALPILRYSAEP